MRPILVSRALSERGKKKKRHEIEEDEGRDFSCVKIKFIREYSIRIMTTYAFFSGDIDAFHLETPLYVFLTTVLRY